MNKISAVILYCSLALLLWHCSKDAAVQPAPDLGCTEYPDVCALNEANNQFGFDLFRKLQTEKPEENLFISPMSIGTALTMTLNGAAGATRGEMLKTLNLQHLDLDKINAAYQTWLRVMPNLDPAVTARMANSIWYREGFPVRPPFLATCTDYYQSEVAALNFADPAAVSTINNWVSSATEGRIQNMLDNIPDNAVMYLINAIYFKGDWKTPYDPKNTFQAPFYRTDGATVQMDLMNHGGIRLPYSETDLFQAVDLAYGKEDAFSMTVFLPKENTSVSDLAARLEAGEWTDWMRGFAVDSIIFGMPKFELAYEKTLNNVLIALGMTSAFNPDSADFSQLVDGPQVYIDEVKHKSFIKVDEKGTEAAAATSVGVGVTSLPQIPTVILNRPFLFVIREKGTNAVLFVGQLMNPAAE